MSEVMRHGNIVVTETALELQQAGGAVRLSIPRDEIRSVALGSTVARHRVVYGIVAWMTLYAASIEIRKLWQISTAEQYAVAGVQLLGLLVVIAFCAVNILRKVPCLIVVTNHGVERIFLDRKADVAVLMASLARSGVPVVSEASA